VAEARTSEGLRSVLKLAIPGLDPTFGELRTLLAAQGRGYGCLLNELGLSIDAQIDTIYVTLLQAWAPLPVGARFMNGAEKAGSLANFIAMAWRRLREPCSSHPVDLACRFADDRRRAFDPATAILAHGDAHACNTLVVPGTWPRRFKLVDPEGLFIERAYDLGVRMREWGAELLAGDPQVLGQRRCQHLARLSGVAAEAIWQWRFIERTSTGLILP
jgi:streptomycin 6-kinase